MMASVLIVEDDTMLCENMARHLRDKGYHVDTAGTLNQARAFLKEKDYDIAVIDLRLPDGDGLELLDHLQQSAPDTIAFCITAFSDTDSVLRAFRKGAHDYLIKPFTLEELTRKISQALRFRRLERENIRLRQVIQQDHVLETGAFVGTQATVSRLRRLVRQVAPYDSTVLITGESGTGKELVAKAIHFHSKRKGPLVPINLSAIPEGLAESVLFGHRRGAFTDAREERMGAFRTAEKGTLFLDEVGDMPLSLQPKILRALESREIYPVGSDTPIPVDVRVIAATHRNLQEMVSAGSFREDLYHRLTAFEIAIPPLRERPEDIPLLARHFLEYFRDKFGKPIYGIDRRAMQCLTRYRWPGNVRELSNVIERSVLLCERDYLSLQDLPEKLCTQRTMPDRLQDALTRFAHQHILSVLEAVDYDKREAAKRLGIS
ncbi:MAG: sigma-54-dependent Fis family transcriptional regulator, partial [Gammaproteobacteria bacterium]